MSATSTVGGDSPLAASLQADPFTSLAIHYGMLLGVSDFQVLAANPRGKLQLHQAWQHGKGVVWGYPVSFHAQPAELVVGPGLAVDGLGREVASNIDLCLDVPAWLDDQIAHHGFAPTTSDDGNHVRFGARLVLDHRACLSGPVPAIGSTCGETHDAVAYSRVLELAHLELIPYERNEDGDWLVPPDDRTGTFEAVRALVRSGVVPPALAADGGDWLATFRAVTADAGAALGPPGLVPTRSERTRLYPEDEPGRVVLADLRVIELTKVDGSWRLDVPSVDLAIRRAHLPTWVIEELLAELLQGQAGPTPVADAGGPRVRAIEVDGVHVRLSLTADVVGSTAGPALTVRSFDTSVAAPAWGPALDVSATLDVSGASGDQPTTITFDLPSPPTDTLTFRLVLRGTGPTPLVGLVDGRPVPLAGWARGVAGRAADGHDVVQLLEGDQP